MDDGPDLTFLDLFTGLVMVGVASNIKMNPVMEREPVTFDLTRVAYKYVR